MLIIFDFDGTLADTWTWLAGELVQGADRFGYRRVTRAQVEEMRGMPTGEVLGALGIERHRLPGIAAELRQRAEAEASRFKLFDGMPALIRALRRRDHTLAIASSNSEQAIRTVLTDELAGMFSFYGCQTDVFGKAATYAEIMRRAGVGPDQTLAVGDETRDLQAARTVGIEAIGVEWGYTDAAVLRSFAPGRTAASIDQLAAMLLGE